MNAFSKLQELAAQQEAAKVAKQQAELELKSQYDAMVNGVKFDWLCQTLDNLGVEYDINNVRGNALIVDGFRFYTAAPTDAVFVERLPTGEAFKHGFEGSMFHLMVEHVGLAKRLGAMADEPYFNQLSVSADIAVYIPRKRDWQAIAATVAGWIEKLTAELDRRDRYGYEVQQ